MTPHSFWTIFLKIIGIFIFFESLAIAPMTIGSIYYLFNGGTYADSSGFYPFFLSLFSLGFCLFSVWVFTFKTEWIINKLSLDKHFKEERFDFHIHRIAVLQISIIVIGGLILIDSVPDLCKELFNFYQSKSIFREDPRFGELIFIVVKTMTGYFLMTNNRKIANYIEFFRRKGKTDEVK